MNHLFSKSSLMILESLSFTKTLYAFDFDGTLSKIVRVPSEATMNQTTTALLKQLSELASVAIISGRSIEDLRERVPFQPQYLIGNHGLEGLGNNHDELERAHEDCKKWRKKLDEIEFGSGVEIEDKTYSLAIHYRRSRNKREVRVQIKDAVAHLTPAPRIIAGKAVINLLPVGAPHKGVAVLELMKRHGMKNALYIGDDDTDEDVFSLPDNRIMTVRVGEKRASHARYFIRQQSETNRLLKLLVQYHRPFQRLKEAQ